MDIEINGFPVDINMKLDDTGAAFFVEEMEEGEEEDEWLSNLATSPLPNQTLDWTQRRNGTLKPNPLFQSETQEPTTGCQEEDEEVLARVLADAHIAHHSSAFPPVERQTGTTRIERG